MKKKISRFLSLMLCLTMLLGMAPAGFAAELTEETAETAAEAATEETTAPATEETVPCQHVWDGGVGSETVITYTCILCGETRDEIVVSEATEPAETEENEPEETAAETMSEAEGVDAVALGVVASGTCGENLTWVLDDAGVLTISGTGEMSGGTASQWIAYQKNIQSIVISQGVSSICTHAFQNLSNVTSVEIPDSVTLIGTYAFAGCISLQSVTIPGSVETISGYAFNSCKELTYVEIRNGTSNIAGAAFLNCEKLTTVKIPNSVETIGDNAFKNCTSLASIYIPTSVTSIGASAFVCSGLVNIELPSSITSISNSLFSQCESLVSVSIPDSVTIVGDCAFRYCSNLVNIELPNSVISIGICAFESCTNLKNIVIPEGVAQIADTTFAYCENLENVIIPEGIKEIGDYAFQRCSCLSEFTIPGSVTEIGTMAFAFCSALKEIVIPKSVTRIGGSVFYGCEKLERAVILGSDNWIHLKTFCGCSNLVEVVIPKCVTKIDELAFSSCGKLKDVYYAGLEGDIQIYSFGNDDVKNATWHFNWDESASDGLAVYSDYTNLSICTGDVITLGAGILENGERIEDISGITFQIADGSILSIVGTDVKDNCRYIKVKGLKPGTSIVAFYDSLTDQTVKVPVTVYDRYRMSYTLSSVPTQYNNKYPTNFYNFNGLYIDNYKYTVNEDKSARVTFDVYNTTYVYGIVEVYDGGGNIKSGQLIKRNKTNSTSIKEGLWDNIGGLLQDFKDGDMMTYRQESGFSTVTNVDVTIPAGGFIMIGLGAKKSPVVCTVNILDILMSFKSLCGDIKNYDANDSKFTEKLTAKMFANEAFTNILDSGEEFTEKMMKNVAKKIFFTSKWMEDFTSTVVNNISELDDPAVIKLLIDTASDFGWSTGEDIVTSFMGPCREALNLMFTMGKMENVGLQCNHLAQLADTGFIQIQNQGGGVLSSQQIKVESESGFSDDTALNVFKVTLDSELFAPVIEENPELYERLFKQTTHTYNISLLKNGQEIQPDSQVTVYIPIPEDLLMPAYRKMTKLYRIEDDGKATEMDFKVEGGCFVFTTEHFSLYIITDCEDCIGQIEVPLYRLYSPVTGEHLYTSDIKEWDFLGTVGWMQEGIAWYAATEGDPVYRLYNAGDGTHLYTMGEKEIENCVAMGWTVDGVVTYSADSDGMPVVRLYSPVAVSHYHLYTVDRDEIDKNCALGWIEEGIAWYAVGK